jgi:CRISPR-associated protein Csm1
MEQKEFLPTLVAAVLHDVGVIWTRADGGGKHELAGAEALRSVPELLPATWRQEVWSAVESHHARPGSRLVWSGRAADRLASGELAERRDGDPASVPLRPTIALVDLGRMLPPGDWGYPLQELSGDKPCFPKRDVSVSRGDYVAIRDGLQDDLERLAGCGGVASLGGVTGLLSALRRWTTYVPASAPGERDEEFPVAADISLYDHLKLTGAVAACLAGLEDGRLRALAEGRGGAESGPVALMLRADFSGIQRFIYRITASRADGTFAGAARRLRGRSLYLTLLAEVVADWFLRGLSLPATNGLFNGGGRFDLLLPLGTEGRVQEMETDVQGWLLDTFYGELGIQLALASVHTPDFADMRDVYGRLDDALAVSKRRKFAMFVRGRGGPAADFHVPGEQRYHACNVCHLTPLPNTYTCDMCELHEQLGRKLPKTSYIAFAYGEMASRLPEVEVEAVIPFGKTFDVTVALLNDEETDEFVRRAGEAPGPAALYRLNDADCIPPGAPPGLALGFRFLANEAPLDAEENVLDFDGIAKKSEGAKLLGVLKADVDRLGFIFGEGVTPTLARASALSGAMELFFGGWLDKLCRDVAAKTFYAVYAGGDDLMILGPWDRVLTLAQKLHGEFRRYACENENVTLSAGVLLVKPHFPIHRFARLVGEALEEAKDKGRNRITVFADTVDWDHREAGYERLLAFGQEMAEKVEKQELHKGFVYFLKRLHDAHFDEDGGEDPMWVPKFYYAVARRVSEEVMRDLELLSRMPDVMPHIQVPVSYVSLKTRKE